MISDPTKSQVVNVQIVPCGKIIAIHIIPSFTQLFFRDFYWFLEFSTHSAAATSTRCLRVSYSSQTTRLECPGLTCYRLPIDMCHAHRCCRSCCWWSRLCTWFLPPHTMRILPLSGIFLVSEQTDSVYRHHEHLHLNALCSSQPADNPATPPSAFSWQWALPDI